MSQENETFDHNDDLPQQSEREALEQRAKVLNINFHSSISTEKLRERVNSVLQGNSSAETSEGTAPTMPKGESPEARRSRKRAEASKLIRVRIHCNDPAKKEWPGEYITVGNSYVGTFRKYVPYNLDEPFHLPQILINALREKRVQVFSTKKGKHGIPTRESKSIPAYTLEIMPALSQEELTELARSQVARNALSDNN